MLNEFEIIDEKGIIESSFADLSEAKAKLDELKNEGFEFEGIVKIVEVHHSE